MKRYYIPGVDYTASYSDTLLSIAKSFKALFFFILFVAFNSISNNINAQTYSGSYTFGTGPYSFNYTIVCSADGSSATITADFTAPPIGNVPRLNLGGGVFVDMSGPNPYTYTLTGLTACDFSFNFRIQYAGATFISPILTPATFPVTLGNFSIIKQGESSALLEWETTSEINSDYFLIQRSIDGNEWANIDEVKAAGNSERVIYYSYLDSQVALSRSNSNKYYYRLKPVDLDGSFEYSEIRGINFGLDSKSVTVYPNPMTNQINIDLSSIDFNSGKVQLAIFNNTGVPVMQKVITGSGIELLEVANLPASIYQLLIKQGTEIIAQERMVKAF